MFHLTFDIGDGPQEIETTLWAIVSWERKYKTKVSQMADNFGFEDLAYLAYESCKAHKIVVPAVFDDFCKKVRGGIEARSKDDRPTHGEPDDAS
jgi:hypothetical protein